VVAWLLPAMVILLAVGLEEAKAGSKIAFTSTRDAIPLVGRTEIYVMNASDGSNVTNLTNNPSSYEFFPAWSPDGTQIAFGSNRDFNGEIYVMNAADGSSQTNLTNHSSGDLYPAWSPDGTQIAFMSSRDGNHGIYVMNAADGSNVTNLTIDSSVLNGGLAWSPEFDDPSPVPSSSPFAKLILALLALLVGRTWMRKHAVG